MKNISRISLMQRKSKSKSMTENKLETISKRKSQDRRMKSISLMTRRVMSKSMKKDIITHHLITPHHTTPAT